MPPPGPVALPASPPSPPRPPLSLRRRLAVVMAAFACLAALAACTVRVVFFRSSQSITSIRLERGNLSLMFTHVSPVPKPAQYIFNRQFDPGLDPHLHLEWSKQTIDLTVPFSLPLFALSGLTLWLVLKPRAAAPGHCLCGYPLADLTTCPECGRAATNLPHA